MKYLISIAIAILTIPTLSYASGCDWDQSGLEEVGSIEFKTSGTLKCIGDNPCIFEMNSYDGKDAMITLTGPKNVLPGQNWLKHLDGKIKKNREFGSCYDDGEIIVTEVSINGNTFTSSQLSYDSPVWP